MNKAAIVALWIALAGTPAPADEVAVLARNLAGRSENIAAEYPQFGNLTLCVGQGGFMEWAADLEGGSYFVHFLYCSGEARACRMSIKAEDLPGDVLGEITGGFMPHLKGLYVSPRKEPPARSVFPMSREEVAGRRAKLNLEGFRKAVACLAEKYRDSYPNAGTYFAGIDAIEKALARRGEDPRAVEELAERVDRLRHDALVLDHPRLACGKLLFVKRHTYQSSHYYTEYIDGCLHFGGNLCVLSIADGEVTELVPELAGGILGRYDLSFDGRRVVVGYKARQEAGFRLWEVGVDGRGLRQITLFTVVGAPHMPAGVGTVIRLDLNYPIRTREPMTYITPEVDVRTEYGWFHRHGDQWAPDTRGPLFTDVWPLDDRFFLASANLDRKYNDVAGYALYLIDEFGNRVLIHRERETSCWQPIPLAPPGRPPVLPASEGGGKKGTGPICRYGPEGASHKLDLSPFSPRV